MRIQSISGNLIELRRLTRQDIHSLRNNANDKKVSEFIPFIPHPYTMDQSDSSYGAI